MPGVQHLPSDDGLRPLTAVRTVRLSSVCLWSNTWWPKASDGTGVSAGVPLSVVCSVPTSRSSGGAFGHGGQHPQLLHGGRVLFEDLGGAAEVAGRPGRASESGLRVNAGALVIWAAEWRFERAPPRSATMPVNLCRMPAPERWAARRAGDDAEHTVEVVDVGQCVDVAHSHGRRGVRGRGCHIPRWS
jgi:hypothetical protein